MCRNHWYTVETLHGKIYKNRMQNTVTKRFRKYSKVLKHPRAESVRLVQTAEALFQDASMHFSFCL